MKTQLQQGIGRAPREPERGVYAASRFASTESDRAAECLSSLKRPEGRAPQSGIALVITLIMLSVITFMAVTFLVVSRHEGEQVDTTTQQNISKFTADGIEKMAEAQLAAQMMGTTNGFAYFGLQVSTNYVTPSFATGISSINNVAYNYYPEGPPLSASDQLIMLNNLLYLPRAPVFIRTNRNQTNPEFRFYLDENGNGAYDTNGFITNTDINGQPLPPIGTAPQTSVQVGDPEWIGFLEHPEQQHSASNMFLSRGAFIALPIGNSLDINHVHNQAKFLVNSSLADNPYEGFFRNEGMGTWEINFAAFLQTLNTNIWGAQLTPNNYMYLTNQNFANQGAAFYDAAAVMQFRNNGNYNVLSSFQHLYGSNASFYFDNDFLDGYTGGILLTGTTLPSVDYDSKYSQSPWSGSDNPVQIVRPRDLLTTIPGLSSANLLNSFTNRLYSAGTNLDTYDRYTFYQLLSQMGIGSAPEPEPYPVGGSFSTASISAVQSGPPPTGGLPPNVPAGRNQMSFGSVPEAYPYPNGRKMNLNYVNVGGTNATNFIPWTPVGFFTNAADRMLRTSFPTNFAMLISGSVVVTNLNINFIPIYPVNYYTPAVHRILQLAANMYDASTNKNNGGQESFDYPSVFRPYFAVAGSGANTVIYITGYTEAAPLAGRKGPLALPANCFTKPLDLRRPTDLSQLISDASPLNTVDNVYGVPYVVGARTNLPNFNQFSMATVVQITRTLQFTRTSPTAPVSSYKTNIAYVIGVSNVLGVQCWNSYTNSFDRLPSGIQILATNDFSMTVTNTINGLPYYTNGVFGLSPPKQLVINPWTNGINMNNGSLNTAAFQVPMLTNATVLPMNSALLQNGGYSTNGTVFIPLAVNPITQSYYPDWGISVTNRVRVIIQDMFTGRILDYVELGGLGQLSGLDAQDGVVSNMYAMNLPPGYSLWDTNRISTNNPLPKGLFNQYAISLGTISVPSSYWASSPSGSSPGSIQQAIQGFQGWLTGVNQANQIQLPFVATTTFAKVYTWSANDPLVHYTVGDLTDLTKAGANNVPVPLTTASPTNVLSTLNGLSPRYRPWGNTSGLNAAMVPITADELEYTDPQMTQSSAWLFPTNKYPNVGWLGRVHRGTPWQTVYLKAHSTSFNNTAWQYWTGNPNLNDALSAQPMNDWQLLDLFATAPNDNASRGQLSVNQANSAAWAAVLAGVMVLSNSPTGLVSTNIDPSQSNPNNGNLIQYIVSGINAQQAAGTLTSVGQILAVPQLTTASPYLGVNNANLTDAVYERIPQQIAGLLRVGTPRYAIYAYGQALKPANNSIVQSGSFFGMCTNYQITGEVLTRTIVRFDNMPVPGYPAPGQSYAYALPLQNATTPSYVWVTNTMPLMRTVVESYEVLGPDQ